MTSCVLPGLTPPSFKGGICEDEKKSVRSCSGVTAQTCATSAKVKNIPSHSQPLQYTYTTDKYGRRVLVNVNDIIDEGYETRDISRYVSDKTCLNTKINEKGEIITSGLTLKIPDLSKEYKNQLEHEFKRLREANCRENLDITRYMKLSINISGILLFILSIGILIYIIYRSFIYNPDTI